MKQLNKTVLVGGVVYPAGTPATPELEQVISSKHWDGQPDALDSDGGTDDGSRTKPDPDLRPVAYEAWKKADLEAEVDKRNADRDPDGEAYIQVDEPKNKADYVAALEYDDAGD